MDFSSILKQIYMYIFNIKILNDDINDVSVVILEVQ